MGFPNECLKPVTVDLTTFVVEPVANIVVAVGLLDEALVVAVPDFVDECLFEFSDLFRILNCCSMVVLPDKHTNAEAKNSGDGSCPTGISYVFMDGDHRLIRQWLLLPSSARASRRSRRA